MELKNSNRNKEIKGGFNKFVRFSTIAFEMGIIIACGSFGGAWLDDYLDLNTPVFTIVLSLFSIFAALYLVIKQVNNVNKS